MDEDIVQTTNKSIYGRETYSGTFNDPNISVAIILGMDSSERRSVQTRGRVIRKTSTSKQAEIFNIVIRHSQEEKWYKDSHKNSNYITIDEKGLEQVLNNENPELYKKKIQEQLFRY
jgi:superfamily II DNA or RNA helicase